MTEVFSSNSELVLQRVVDAPRERTGISTHENIKQVYQIMNTCQFINQQKFLKVALQFPDELLADSVAIAAEIRRETQAKLFILGDTSYGSCCVDEVAAQHVGADCIVHYGKACLSPSTRLPLMYVFERGEVDLKQCASAFRQLYSDTMDNIIVLYDVNYAYVAVLMNRVHSTVCNSCISRRIVQRCPALTSRHLFRYSCSPVVIIRRVPHSYVQITTVNPGHIRTLRNSLLYFV